MSAPDYALYSIEELHEVLGRIDRDSFPERLESIKREIKKRGEMGEIFSKHMNNPLWNPELSLSVTARIWWCYYWRFTLSFIVFYVASMFGLGILNSFIGLGDDILMFVEIVVPIASSYILSILFLNQALTKRYKEFDIHIVQREKSNRDRELLK